MIFQLGEKVEAQRDSGNPTIIKEGLIQQIKLSTYFNHLEKVQEFKIEFLVNCGDGQVLWCDNVYKKS